MHTNSVVAHAQYLGRHFRNNLDFEIGVMVHIIHFIVKGNIVL
jgi:hypothetical protein